MGIHNLECIELGMCTQNLVSIQLRELFYFVIFVDWDVLEYKYKGQFWAHNLVFKN